MCGIAGIVGQGAALYEGRLDEMVAALEHRGPDGYGTWSYENCLLGHTRLAIVDLDGGQQPMVSGDGRLSVTFNGEIYGYRDIRKRLNGYPFQTTSDTEVILALYRQYGSELCKHLPGMFSFALWDEFEQQLFCARDRFGEKPFYYAFGKGGEFVFASEIKAILASGLITPVIDRAAVGYYLQHLCVPSDKTIYSNIFILPPAHMLQLRAGRSSVIRYWSPPATCDSFDLVEASEEFRRLFEEAVSKQLIADVPVGTFLSGGLDSSSVVAAASMHGTAPRTYSFSFDGDYSEAPYARAVAERFGADHNELSAEGEDLADLLIDMQRVYDEPFADSSNIPTFLLCREARRHVKVALSGDGGDEMLGGYDWYRSLHYMNPENPASRSELMFLRVVQKAARLMRLKGARQLEKRYGAREWTRKFSSMYEAYASYSKWFDDRELSAMGIDSLASNAELFPSGADDLNDIMRFDTEHYLASDILVKVDRASMAWGLEVRAPFLDMNLASFCIALPSRLKLNDATDKLVLREAYSHLWPTAVRQRTKQGFGAPVHRWLRRAPVQALLGRTLGDRKHVLYSVLPWENCRPYVGESNYKTWILLVLALWLEGHSAEIPEA